MASFSEIATEEFSAAALPSNEFGFVLPDPEDDKLHEVEFESQIEREWQVCDRPDCLQLINDSIVRILSQGISRRTYPIIEISEKLVNVYLSLGRITLLMSDDVTDLSFDL